MKYPSRMQTKYKNKYLWDVGNNAFGENVQRTQACKTLAEYRGAVSMN